MPRRTKIIATVGPASESEPVLRGLIRAGMDVARLGMAHSSLEENAERLALIRRLAAEEGRAVGVLVDLPGPKVRSAGFGEDPVEFALGAEVQLRVGDRGSRATVVEVDYEAFFHDVEPGDRLSLGDGRVILELGEQDGERMAARVVHGGVLSGRPGVHIPSEHLSLTAPTPEDLRATEFFVEHDVDMIALSFVRTADDIDRLDLPPHPEGPLVVAKVETAAAIDDLPGIEDPATRLDGSSAVMLSGETAVGIDPVNVVATMDRVARHADDNFDHHGWSAELAELHLTGTEDQGTSITDAMTGATARAVEELGIDTIVCVSGSGFTVRSMARFRPSARILGYSANERTVRQLALSWGTEPVHLPVDGEVDLRVAEALDLARESGGVSAGELVAVLAGTDPRSRATNELRLERVPEAS